MRNIKNFLTTLCLIFAITLLVPYAAPAIPTAITAQAAQKTAKISKTKATLIKGQTLSLKITGTSKTVKWSSSKKSVASVSSSGKVTAVSKGTATITAKVGSKSYTCKITVEAPALSKNSLILVKGTSYTPKLSGTAQKVTWHSSNTKIAAVSSSGKVLGLTKGTATITAKIGSKKYACKVTVETPSLSKRSLTMCTGTTASLTLKNTKQTVKWSSDNKSIATVSSSGKITAKKHGVVKIKANVVNKTYTCTVKVLTQTDYNRYLLKNYVKKHGVNTEDGMIFLTYDHSPDTDTSYYATLAYNLSDDCLSFRTSTETKTMSSTFTMDIYPTFTPIYKMHTTDRNGNIESHCMAQLEDMKAAYYEKDSTLYFEIFTEGIAEEEVNTLANMEMQSAMEILEEILAETLNFNLADIGFTRYHLQ